MLPTSLSGVFIAGESDSTRGTWLAPSLGGDTPLLEPGEESLLELGVGEVAAWLTGNATGQALWTLGVGTERFSNDFVWESSRLFVTSQRLVWSRRVESDVWELGHMRFEWVDFVEWSETKLAVAAWLPDLGPQGASDLTLMLEMVDPSAASAVGSWLVSLVQNYRRGRVGTLRVRPPSAWNNPPQVQEDESAVMVDLRGAAPLGGFYVREKRKQLGAQTQGLPEGFPSTPLLDAEPRSIDTPPSVAALAASQPPKRIAGSLVRGPAFTPVTLCRHDDPAPGVYPRTCADGDRIAGGPDDGDVWRRYRLKAVEIYSFVPGAGHTRISLGGTFIATASRVALAFPGEAKAIRAAMQQDEDLHRLSYYSLALDLLLDAARTWRAFQDERNVVLAGQVPYSAIMSLSSASSVPERLTISFSESLTNPGWPREFFFSVLLAEGEETAATVTGRLALAIVHQRLQEEGIMPADRRALEEVATAAEHDDSASRYEFPAHVPISDAEIGPA